MRVLYFRRPIAGLTLGLMLVSGPLAYGHGDEADDHADTGSYESGRAPRAGDSYDPYDPASQAPSSRRAPQPSYDPDSYESGRATRSRDPYDPYDPTLQAPPSRRAPQPSPDPYGSGAYGSGRTTRAGDPYDPYDPATQAPPSRRAPYSSGGSGTPFGVSKSTAGAVAGALLGAGSGAIIGSHRGNAGPGAAIGAGVGAVGGYVVGRQIEGRDHALDAQDQLIERQQQEIARNRTLLEELKRRKLEARETDRGVVVNLPDVFFAFNSARLTPEAHSKVAHIAAVLQDRARDRKVAIEGHADAIGSEAYNLALSQQRAGTVARELASNGVREPRLTTRGYGKKYPVAPNTNPDGSDNPAGRAKNRRVEVVIAN